MLDPCVLVRVPVHLEPDVTTIVKFALSTSSTVQSAAAAAKRILTGETSVFSRLDETARALGFGIEQVDEAMALMPALVYPSPDRRIKPADATALRRGQQGLWCLGVSGDLPIVACAVDDDSGLAAAGRLLNTHRLLSRNNIAFDLVYLVRGGGDYRGKLKNDLMESLKLSDPDRRLEARGGVHIAELPSDGADLVRAAAVRTVDVEKLEKYARDETTKADFRPFISDVGDGALTFGYDDENSFTFQTGRLPGNAWSHMLANESFGYLATDAGTGHMWHRNARENKINRWLNDSLTTDGTERLTVFSDDRQISLFAELDGCECAVTYGFGWARWQKKIGQAVITTTAFVPPDLSARLLIVENGRRGRPGLDVLHRSGASRPTSKAASMWNRCDSRVFCRPEIFITRNFRTRFFM